ncbi:xanthine dehydrogenase family protein subunit M [Oscillospiraceae bacterium HV4-5-C5C]|nr:xanthine dehydrogenase family protein subunit M [Oscillospiraceae bacterium HV4-5-C5C]
MVNSYAPENLSEALRLLQAGKVTPYAGGTDIMVHPRAAASYLFLRQLPELGQISATEQFYVIGSTVTYQDLLTQTKVDLPDVLLQACRKVAAPPIRNLGTLGGNICNASPAGDTLPVLYALDASVRLARFEPASVNVKDTDGSISYRLLPLRQFIQGVRRTCRQPDELLTEILIPKVRYTLTEYEKIAARKAQAISKVSFCGAAAAEAGQLTRLALAFGSVGVTVVRDSQIETAILNGDYDIAAAVKAYDQLLRPITDQRSTAGYRRTVCLNLVRNFLTAVLAQTRSGAQVTDQ